MNKYNCYCIMQDMLRYVKLPFSDLAHFDVCFCLDVVFIEILYLIT